MPQKLKFPEYDSFTATRTHIHDNGLSMMPTAGPFPQPSNVVALHGGMDFDAIAYVAVRRGECPVIPSPITTNKNRVFLKGGRVGYFPIPDVAGVMTYYVSGWMLFGILSPEGLASTFYLGSLPFQGVDKNEFIPGSYFNYQLVNQNQTQTLVQVPNLDPILQTMISQG